MGRRGVERHRQLDLVLVDARRHPVVSAAAEHGRQRVGNIAEEPAAFAAGKEPLPLHDVDELDGRVELRGHLALCVGLLGHVGGLGLLGPAKAGEDGTHAARFRQPQHHRHTHELIAHERIARGIDHELRGSKAHLAQFDTRP